MKRKRTRELYELRSHIDPLTGKERKEALYTGSYYQLTLETGQKHGLGITLALFLFISILLFLLCGLLDSPGSRSFYVLPFFLLMTFPLFYACMAVFRFSRLPQPFTELQKELSLHSLIRSCMGLMILCTLYALGDLLFLFLGGAGERLGTELAALLCVLGIGALAALLYRKGKAVEVVPCPQEN